MAIYYGTTNSDTKTSAGHTTHDINFDMTSQDDRVLVVFVNNNSGVAVSGITYNGDALTNAGVNAGTSDYIIETWYLVNPDTGNNSIVVTFGSSVTGSIISASSIYGARQSGQPEDAIGISTSNSSVTDSFSSTRENCLFMVASIGDNEPSFSDGEVTVSTTTGYSRTLKSAYAYADSGSKSVTSTKTGSNQFNLQGVMFSPSTPPTIVHDDTTTDSKVEGIPYTTHTVSHTVTTIENRVLVVMVTQTSGSIDATATWNGTSMIDAGLNIGTGSFNLRTFYLLNPDSGTHDCVITWTSASVIASIVSVMSFRGILQSSPSDSASVNQSSSGNISSSIDAIYNNSLYIVGVNADSEVTFFDGEIVTSNDDNSSCYLKVGHRIVNTPTEGIGASQTGASQMNLNAIVFSPITTTSNASMLINFI